VEFGVYRIQFKSDTRIDALAGGMSIRVVIAGFETMVPGRVKPVMLSNDA